MTGLLTRGLGAGSAWALITRGYAPASPPSAPLLLRQAVRSRLAGSTAIAAIAGTRIFPGALPQAKNVLRQGAALSYLIATRTSGHHLGGADGTSSARLQIDCWSTLESEADALAIAVADLFDGYRGTIGGLEVLACLQQDEVDLPEAPKAGTDQWIYHISLDYLISHRIALPAALGA